MKREFFTPAEIIEAGSPDLPSSISGLNRTATRQGWRSNEKLARQRSGREGGGGWEYHISLLPESVRIKLQIAFSSPANSNDNPDKTAKSNRDALWQAYERLSRKNKTVCQQRLDILIAIETVRVSTGCTDTVAIEQICLQHSVSPRTIYSYRQQIAGVDRSDWLAALAPVSSKPKPRKDIDQAAWQALIGDYLRPEAPRFSACYRRLERAAPTQGWENLPSERSLRRRLNDEIDLTTQKLAREGSEKTRILFPPQKRTVAGMHAMQAVNMDGHKFDVFVKWYDGAIVRPVGVALQDIYSRKIVAMRLSDSENKEVTRLAIGDMVTEYGIPDALTTDNSRSFASKWITGGTPNRFRFKVRDEDPKGLLTTLGVDIHFAIPGRGQSKPIERGFRDLAETISRHPACSGAYTGNHIDAKPENYRERAIPADEFEALVKQEIAAHNAQVGRRTEMANGRSFDQVFQESLEAPSTIVRWPTEAQRSLWMLAAEKQRTQKGTGEIVFCDNRYWAHELNGIAGQQVIIRFDPQDLHEGIKVYDLEDRFVCDARCVVDTGFYDMTSAREHNRDAAAYLKARKEELRLVEKLRPQTLARLYADSPIERESNPQPPKVQRLAIAGQKTPRPAINREQDIEDEEAEVSFGRGLKLLSGGRS